MTIRGAGGGGKSGGGGRVAQEAPDSLRSKQYARVLDLVSEGEIEGLVDGLRSVYLDETPIQNEDGSYNFDGFSIGVRTGTQSQSVLPAFAGVETERAVGVQVEQATPVVRTITSADIDAARVTVSVPRLQKQDPKTGDIDGTSVRIAIDVQSNGGGYVPFVLGTRGINLSVSGSVASSLSAKVTSAQVRVNWKGEQIRDYQSVRWRVDYRAVGASTWVALKAGSFSGRSVYDRGNWLYDFDDTWKIITGSATAQFTPATPGAFEFRVVKVSGDGTITNGGGDATELVDYDDIRGKTSSSYQRAYRIPLTGNPPWDIRVRRITADSTSQALQNDTYFSSYTEIIDDKFSYPNSAIIGLSVDSERFASIPTRGYDIKGIIVKIPSNYDPVARTYTGVWDGTFTTAWTDNPAWIFYDMVTNDRYGSGHFVPEPLVDKWALYEISQYCDEMVESGFGYDEPRFTCNVYLQKPEDAYKVLQSLVSVFRAVIYWAGGAIVPVQDSPKQPTALFTKANVIDGAFEYSGSAGKTRATTVMVQWNDPMNGFKRATEYVEDQDGIARYGVIEKSVDAIGCSSRGQANRFGRAILFSESMETETISFLAGMDGLGISPGEIIQTSDPVRAGERRAGRITSATTTVIDIDDPVTIASGSYTLWVVLPDGSVESRDVITGAGTTSSLTVSSAFSAAPQSYSMWVLGSDDIVPETWRVLSVEEQDSTTAKITALEYRADKYAAIEQGLELEPLDTSNIAGSTQDKVTEVEFDEELYLINSTTVGTNLAISWTGNAQFYDIEYRKGDGNFNRVTTSSTAYELRPVTAGTYTIRIVAVSSIGVRSQPSVHTVEVYGLTVPPNDVSGFNIQAINSNAHFTFDASTDLDVIVGGYLRIRHAKAVTGATWAGAVDIGPKVPGSATNAVLPLMRGTYLAKWVDGSGNESVNATLISTTAPSVISMNAIASVTEDPDYGGTYDGTVKYDFAGTPSVVVDSPVLIDEITENIDDWPTFDFYGGTLNDVGYYYFQDSIDLGAVYTSRISAAVKAIVFLYRDTVDTWEDFDAVTDLDGDAGGAGDVIIEYRATNDDPTLTPTWTDWQTLEVGDVDYRAFEFRAKLVRYNDIANIALLEASVEVDMPDKVQAGDDLATGVGVYSASFAEQFFITPAIGISAQDLATGDYYEISNKSNAGFDIVFKNSSGTPVSRTFDYIARAY